MKNIYLVTAGAHGLALAITKRLLEEGDDVIVTFHQNVSEADALKAQYPERVFALHADLEKPESMAELVSSAFAWKGKLTGIVNAASDFSSDDLERQLAIHVRSPFVIANTFSRLLNDHQETGAIVNILDSYALTGGGKKSAYRLSKRSLAEQTKLLAVTLGPVLRINAVSPGLVLSHSKEEAQFFQREEAVLPLRRGGTPSDVASAVVFLLTTSSVTGVILEVDGGHHLL